VGNLSFMKKLICIKCGNEALANSLCKDHFKLDAPLLRVKAVDIIVRCKKCQKYFVRGIKSETIEDAIDAATTIHTQPDTQINIDFKERGKKFYLKVNATKKENGVEVKDEEKVLIKLSTAMCIDCSRVSGGYSEAVIQYRANNEKDVEFLLSKSSFLKESKNGMDFFFTNKGEATKIAKDFRSKYAVIKTSKLMGKKKGKEIYKDFYSVKEK